MMIPDLSKRGWPAFAINSAIFLMITAISWAASMAFNYFWKLAELPFNRKKAAKTTTVEITGQGETED